MVGETTQFKKVKKKFSLNNSYFKNRYQDAPATPVEVFKYFIEHGELPFEYSGNNWIYDCYIEYQKRARVWGSQFFTPDKTANQMAALALFEFNASEPVLDLCCGFGQLTEPLLNAGFYVDGVEIAYDLADIYRMRYDSHHQAGNQYRCSFTEVDPLSYSSVVSNPPYEIPALTDLFIHLHRILKENGKAILLIPQGFIDKDRPKALVEAVSKFEVLRREPMQEEFVHTKVRAEIVVLEKK